MQKKIKKSKVIEFGFILLFILFVAGCDSTKFDETPIESFKGVWKLEGRSMFSGMKIKIEEGSEGDFIGRVVALNDNKYVQMFVEQNDIWVTGIRRTSNFEFRLTEKKIGNTLFALYGLETTKEYRVEFIDENTIGLGSNNSKPKDSSIKYIREGER